MSAVTHICPECNGRGNVGYYWNGVRVGDSAHPCSNCDGTGWLDEHGEPIPLEEQTKESSDEQ